MQSLTSVIVTVILDVCWTRLAGGWRSDVGISIWCLRQLIGLIKSMLISDWLPCVCMQERKGSLRLHWRMQNLNGVGSLGNGINWTGTGRVFINMSSAVVVLHKVCFYVYLSFSFFFFSQSGKGLKTSQLLWCAFFSGPNRTSPQCSMFALAVFACSPVHQSRSYVRLVLGISQYLRVWESGVEKIWFVHLYRDMQTKKVRWTACYSR